MAHFTYEPRSLNDNLQQGDVISLTDNLREILRSTFPSFDDPGKYQRFAILTQTCDLVRRPRRGGAEPSCGARYITLAAMRPLPVILGREVAKYQNDDIERENGLCRLEHKPKLEQFVERLLNNNADGYFFYNEAGDAVPQPMCAVLPVSIALGSEHYGICRAARMAGLKPVFQAKLGWLLGNSYSRVATEDWVPNTLTSKEFRNKVETIAKANYAWADSIAMRELKEAISEHRVRPDGTAIADFLAQTPSRTERILHLIRSKMERVAEFQQHPKLIESVLKKVGSDQDFQKLIRTEDAGL